MNVAYLTVCSWITNWHKRLNGCQISFEEKIYFCDNSASLHPAPSPTFSIQQRHAHAEDVRIIYKTKVFDSYVSTRRLCVCVISWVPGSSCWLQPSCFDLGGATWCNWEKYLPGAATKVDRLEMYTAHSFNIKHFHPHLCRFSAFPSPCLLPLASDRFPSLLRGVFPPVFPLCTFGFLFRKMMSSSADQWLTVSLAREQNVR